MRAYRAQNLAGTIADIFIAITKRDHDGDISRAEIKAMLSVKDDKTLNSDVVNKLITVIFPHKPEDPTPDSMTVKEFKEMIVNSKGGVKVLRDSMLATLPLPKSAGKSAAHRGPRPEPAWCTNPEAGCSPAWMWHNWDGIFLHSALLGVFIYRYYQFYHGEGLGHHPISIAKGAGLALLFGIFALYLTKLRMLQWLNCIPFGAKVLTASCLAYPVPHSSLLAFLTKSVDHACYQRTHNILCRSAEVLCPHALSRSPGGCYFLLGDHPHNRSLVSC